MMNDERTVGYVRTELEASEASRAMYCSYLSFCGSHSIYWEHEQRYWSEKFTTELAQIQAVGSSRSSRDALACV